MRLEFIILSLIVLILSNYFYVHANHNHTEKISIANDNPNFIIEMMAIIG